MRTFIIFMSFILLINKLNGQTSTPPIVTKEYKEWTSVSELDRWLYQMSDIFNVEMRLYRGNSEINMPVVFIPAVQEDALTVMIIAEQHGDEPSGMEACNLLISELLNGQLPQWTDSVEWVIIPMVNADGHENKTRKKSNGADLNRDHLILSQAETRYVHYMYNRYLPDVFIDMHEYPQGTVDESKGLQKRIQQQIGCITNKNLINPELDDLSHQIILPHVQSKLEKSKISFSEYWIGAGELGNSVRKSTVDIDDARQGLGAMGRSLSFIVEGLNGAFREDNIYLRTQAQYICLLALVESCNGRKVEIKREVALGRANAELKPNDSISIKMDHFKSDDSTKQSLFLPYRNVQQAKDTVLNLSNVALTEIKTIYSIDAPLGYWISKKDKKLVDWIQSHEAGIFPFSVRGGKMPEGDVENLNFQCISGLPEWTTLSIEGMEVPGWKPEWRNMNNPSTKDYIYVSTQTLNGVRWVMALEPESMFALVRYPEFEYLRYQYPILRVISR